MWAQERKFSLGFSTLPIFSLFPNGGKLSVLPYFPSYIFPSFLNSTQPNIVLRGNSTVPPLFFMGVSYPLVSNLLYQVIKISHLIVPSSYCVVLTSHVIVLLSDSVVPLFFLTFDSTILTLCNTNITCDCPFVTFRGSFTFFFSHI